MTDSAVDFILEIPLAGADDEVVQGRLFFTRSRGSTVSGDVLIAYFDTAEDRDAAVRDLADLNPRAGERARVDWLDQYQQSLTAMEIGERFLVAPDRSLLRDSSRLTLVVPQEQAFGTGSHETTALCVEMLERLDIEGKRGLDVGSGSGILAMAMVRLGASRVIAFDNDPDAYAALRENRIRNGVDDQIMPLFIGGVEALRGGSFDVVTMNIIPEVILALLPDVVRLLVGRLILSGILVTRRDDVVEAAMHQDLELEGEREKGEWWAGCFSSRLRR